MNAGPYFPSAGMPGATLRDAFAFVVLSAELSKTTDPDYALALESAAEREGQSIEDHFAAQVWAITDRVMAARGAS